MNRLTNVKCNYTGGGIYVVTARFNDEVWLATDGDIYGTYDVPWEDIEEKYNCEYEAHEKAPSVPLPTWQELLDAVMESYNSGESPNMLPGEVEHIIKWYNPDLSLRFDEPQPEDKDDNDSNSERLEKLGAIIEVFEDFLDERGIVIPNDEKCQDPDASNIYGTDYGELEDRLEDVLRSLGMM